MQVRPRAEMETDTGRGAREAWGWLSRHRLGCRGGLGQKSGVGSGCPRHRSSLTPVAALWAPPHAISIASWASGIDITPWTTCNHAVGKEVKTNTVKTLVECFM